MILMCTEYFLNEEGRSYFPHWLRHVVEKLQEQPGFLGIRQLKDATSGDGCRLLLEFETQELLQRWLASEEHTEALSLLEPFTLKPFSSTQYYAEHITV